ncbi:MAG TPA: 2-dehydropantoate 2-reductase N-terminal domain-containing protein, partial [Methylophilaceae bacterium]|nr:2-dehydropantoate 2-reductase N-terminal domain-containing protein [Methylophilaceae bacterium]
MNITVLGAGAWGTALAMQISRRQPVTLWSRNQSHMAEMLVERCNAKYLGQYPFNDNISLASDLASAIKEADLILSVVPTAGFRNVLQEIKKSRSGVPVIWASKGLETATSHLPHEVAMEELGTQTSWSWGVVSGP